MIVFGIFPNVNHQVSQKLFSRVIHQEDSIFLVTFFTGQFNVSLVNDTPIRNKRFHLCCKFVEKVKIAHNEKQSKQYYSANSTKSHSFTMSSDKDILLPNITHIVAYQKTNRGIGFQNKLLYQLKNDLQHFLRVTLNHVVIMGRKTYESIGRLLPKRINVILSRQMNNNFPKEAHVFIDVTKAITWCQDKYPQHKIFIIGGGEIYETTLPYTSKIIATEINPGENNSALADCFYPEIPLTFKLTESSDIEKDEKDENITFCIKTYTLCL